MPETQMTVEQIKSKRTLYLILSTGVLLFLGLIYAFSMFAKPMTQDFALTGNISLTFNIMMITFCVGSLVGSLIVGKAGVRGALIVCAAMFAIGFCGTGLTAPISGDTMMLYIFYGACGGAGVGIGYNTIVSTTNVWFPDKVGFSSGVLMLGFGVSSLIFGNIALMIRPLLGGMSMVLIVLGIVVGILTLLLAFTLKQPPANVVALMAPEKVGTGGNEAGENDNIFKTPIFYIYYVWAVIVIAVGLATIGNAASDATFLGIDEGFASLLVGLIATFNGGARIILGILFDKTNIKVTMLVDAAVAVCAMALIVAAYVTGIAILYVPGALLCGFAYGGVPVIASAFARQRYGAKKYPFNLSVVNLSIAIGSFINIIVAAAVGGERFVVFAVILVLSAIALADVFVFNKLWDKDTAKK